MLVSPFILWRGARCLLSRDPSQGPLQMSSVKIPNVWNDRFIIRSTKLDIFADALSNSIFAVAKYYLSAI